MVTNIVMKALGVAGAAAAAWYLLDPKNGAARREKLATGARDLYDTAGKELGRMGEDLSAGVSDIVEKVTQATGLAGSSTQEPTA